MTSDKDAGLSVETLPCPFCGSVELHAFEHFDGHESYGFQCARCWITGPQSDTKAKALTAWNRRAEASPAQPRAKFDTFQRSLDRLTKDTIADSLADIADELEKRYGSYSPAQPIGEEAVALQKEDVAWVVNDIAELGVKIGHQFFWLYKGTSLVYDPPEHDDGSPMHWRPVFKREFGECAHPINYADPKLAGTVSLDDSDDWQPLYARPSVPVEAGRELGSSSADLSPASRSQGPEFAGWRTIESAPSKARIPVLLIGEYPSSRRWSDVYQSWAQAPYTDDWVTHWARWPHSFSPTHWMPLPPPPSASGAAVREAVVPLDAISAQDAPPSPPNPAPAVEEIIEALLRMEYACEQLAATRTVEVYDAMILSGQAQALLELDNARRAARQIAALPNG